MKPFAESIENISELLNFIRGNLNSYEIVLFRGQRCDWPLLPKLARITPRRDEGMLGAEARMMDTFRTRAPSVLDHRPASDWEWIAIAQHHGLATRLLDWTTNPLAALWFAVSRPAEQGADGVLWTFTPAGEDCMTDSIRDPFTQSITHIFQPSHVSRRIVAQDGWFTLHKHDPDSGNLVSLEDDPTYTNQLMKLRIPARVFSNLRFELDFCNVNAATLFPDLEGLCQTIEWQQSILTDECPDGESEA